MEYYTWNARHKTEIIRHGIRDMKYKTHRMQNMKHSNSNGIQDMEGCTLNMETNGTFNWNNDFVTEVCLSTIRRWYSANLRSFSTLSSLHTFTLDIVATEKN